MTGTRAGGRHRDGDPAGSAPDRWRLILGAGDGLEPADGARNMGIDVALLDGVRRGDAPALRFYTWAPACLSFGRNQPALGLYDVGAARERGIGFVRRPTGGQAVLHADELTYAVVAPVAVLGRPRDAYRRINEALVLGLRDLGLQVELAQAPAMAGAAPGAEGLAGSADRWTDACFRRPAQGEVVASGRKLVGSAQRMEGRVILQHGSLLLGGSQAAAEELLLRRERRPVAASPGDAAGWTTVDAELGTRPDPEALVRVLTAGFERVLGTSLARERLTDREVADAERSQERYGSDPWTWRR